MGCLPLVGSLKLQVAFAKEPYKRYCILQKRHIILRSLLMVSTPYVNMCEQTFQKISTPKIDTHIYILNYLYPTFFFLVSCIFHLHNILLALTYTTLGDLFTTRKTLCDNKWLFSMFNWGNILCSQGKIFFYTKTSFRHDFFLEKKMVVEWSCVLRRLSNEVVSYVKRMKLSLDMRRIGCWYQVNHFFTWRESLLNMKIVSS